MTSYFISTKDLAEMAVPVRFMEVQMQSRVDLEVAIFGRKDVMRDD